MPSLEITSADRHKFLDEERFHRRVVDEYKKDIYKGLHYVLGRMIDYLEVSSPPQFGFYQKIFGLDLFRRDLKIFFESLENGHPYFAGNESPVVILHYKGQKDRYSGLAAAMQLTPHFNRLAGLNASSPLHYINPWLTLNKKEHSYLVASDVKRLDIPSEYFRSALQAVALVHDIGFPLSVSVERRLDIDDSRASADIVEGNYEILSRYLPRFLFSMYGCPPELVRAVELGENSALEGIMYDSSKLFLDAGRNLLTAGQHPRSIDLDTLNTDIPQVFGTAGKYVAQNLGAHNIVPSPEISNAEHLLNTVKQNMKFDFGKGLVLTGEGEKALFKLNNIKRDVRRFLGFVLENSGLDEMYAEMVEELISKLSGKRSQINCYYSIPIDWIEREMQGNKYLFDRKPLLHLAAKKRAIIPEADSLEKMLTIFYDANDEELQEFKIDFSRLSSSSLRSYRLAPLVVAGKTVLTKDIILYCCNDSDILNLSREVPVIYSSEFSQLPTHPDKIAIRKPTMIVATDLYQLDDRIKMHKRNLIGDLETSARTLGITKSFDLQQSLEQFQETVSELWNFAKSNETHIPRSLETAQSTLDTLTAYTLLQESHEDKTFLKRVNHIIQLSSPYEKIRISSKSVQSSALIAGTEVLRDLDERMISLWTSDLPKERVLTVLRKAKSEAPPELMKYFNMFLDAVETQRQLMVLSQD